MCRLALALGTLVVAAGCTSLGPVLMGPPPLVIRDVTLIDGTGTPPVPHTTIVIVRDRIVDIGPEETVALPPGARLIEGAGRYAIPGLWDMHVHLSKAKAKAFPLFIANGVTSVRDMGGDLKELLEWRREIVEGEIAGPRIFLAGPMFETPASVARTRAHPTHERVDVTRVPVPDSASAEALVDSVAALGVDFIKIREAVSPTAYAAIVRAAHGNALRVAGHPPYSMDPTKAAALGLASFEHASYPYPLDPDADARGRILDAFLEHGVVMVPTLVAWQVSLMDRDSLWALVQDSGGRHDPRRPLISQNLADEWRFDVEGDDRKSEKELRSWQEFFDRQAEDLRAMHKAGVPMLPGSDLAGPSLYPGYALHDEFENLVHFVGLTPMEVLEAATRKSADLLGMADDLGTLEPGKLADIILLDANPLADISNTRRIVAVVADGRLFPEPELNRLLGGLSPKTDGNIELRQRLEPEVGKPR